MKKEEPAKQPSEGEKSFVIYKVIRTIITSGVTPLPRNYELFYELLSGQNKHLARDLLALPHKPDQKLLDNLGEKHHLPGFSGLQARAKAASQSDMLSQLSVRLLKSIKKTDEIYKACQNLKDKQPTIAQALDDLRREQNDLKTFLSNEASKIPSSDAHDDSIAPIATRDTLTGLPNRLLFTEKMADLYQDNLELPVASLIIANIDHLRHLNDAFGISEVNKAMCRLALVLKRRVKSHDFVARISGNEFAVLVDGVSQETAGHIAERLRMSAQKIRLSALSRITLSIGVADNKGTLGPQDFFAKAELALLASRTGKRDCVTLHDRDVAMRSRQAYLMHLKAEDRAPRAIA